jgi:uncharacterized membrane protein YwaF
VPAENIIPTTQEIPPYIHPIYWYQKESAPLYIAIPFILFAMFKRLNK